MPNAPPPGRRDFTAATPLPGHIAIPDGIAPADQVAAIDHQQAIADAVLLYILARLPHPAPYASPAVRVVPLGWWRSETILGFTDAGSLTVILPAAGRDAGNGPFRTHGLSPAIWATILLHEIVHIIEFARSGSLDVVTDALGRYPEDASRPPYRAAIGAASRPLFACPLDTTASLCHWPRDQNEAADRMIGEIAARVAERLAPPARIVEDAEGRLRSVNLFRAA